MSRVLTAAALIPFVIYVVLFAPTLAFLGVLVVAACLSYREYDAIAASYGFGAPGALGYAAGLLLLLDRGHSWMVALGLALAAMAMAMRSADLAHSLPRASFTLLGVVYIFGGWSCAPVLREHSPHWLMYALLITWAGDIGAYYVGRAVGKHPLADRVSPKKSWEGAVASVVLSVLVAGAYLQHFVPGVAIWEIVALTAVANIAGQVGDLAESNIKRGAGVKDSGTLLPGHGGFLDRVDSTLFVLPVVWAYLQLR